MNEPTRVTVLRLALRNYRERTGKSRRVVAQESGLTIHWIEKLEQGVIQNPTARNIETLEAYLRAFARKIA